MKIEVLGMGCSKTKKMAKNTKKAVKEMGIDTEIIRAKDVDEIASYEMDGEEGLVITPALAVDGKVICSDRVPSIKEIKEILNSVS